MPCKHWHPHGQAQRLRRAAALHREAYVTAGYTPFLSFEVEELQDSVQTLLSMGATLDGAIKHMTEGQVGMRSYLPEQEHLGNCRSKSISASPVGMAPRYSTPCRCMQVAVLRGPDGHMISLLQPAAS